MTDRKPPTAPDIRSVSQSTEDPRCLQVWLGAPATARDREWLLAAANGKAPGDAVESALREQIEDLRSTMEAWFDLSTRTEQEVTPILIDGLKGYLHRSRIGGMPEELANAAEAVLEDYCRLYVGKALLPVLRGLAERPRTPEAGAWRDDPRVRLGVDWALVALCRTLGVEPESVDFASAKEGGLDAAMTAVLKAKFGDDWRPDATPAPGA